MSNNSAVENEVEKDTTTNDVAVDVEAQQGLMATGQIDYVEKFHNEIQNKLQQWTPQFPWLSTSSSSSSSQLNDNNNNNNNTRSLVTLDHFNGLEGMYDQGSLAYATATGDFKFLMTFISSKLSEQKGSGGRDMRNIDAATASTNSSTTTEVSPTNGWTRMHVAAAANDAQMIQVLQWRGDDIDALALDGSTPLCVACEMGSFRAAAVLLGFGRGITSFPRHLTSRQRPHQNNSSRDGGGSKRSHQSRTDSDQQWTYADPSICRYDGASPLILSLARADSVCAGVILLAFALDNWAYQLYDKNDDLENTNQATNTVTATTTAVASTTTAATAADDDDDGDVVDSHSPPAADVVSSSLRRQRGLLRVSEVAALLLTFPARDVSNTDSESPEHSVVLPLLKHNILTDPKQWNIYHWLGVDDDDNALNEDHWCDGFGNHINTTCREEETWHECTDESFARDFLVTVKATDDALNGYLQRYTTSSSSVFVERQEDGSGGGGSSSGGGGSSSGGGSGDHVAQRRGRGGVGSVTVSDFNTAKELSTHLLGLEQLVYLGVVTFLSSRSVEDDFFDVCQYKVFKNAPSALLASLTDHLDDTVHGDSVVSKGLNHIYVDGDLVQPTHIVSKSKETQSQTADIHNASTVTDHQSDSSQNSSSLLCGPHKTQELKDVWMSASLSHALCEQEQTDIKLSSKLATSSLELSRGNKNMSKKLSEKKKQIVKDTVDMQWLKAAPQIGKLAPPTPSPDGNTTSHLLEVALLSCRTRCMQAILESIPLAKRQRYVKSLYVLDDQTETYTSPVNGKATGAVRAAAVGKGASIGHVRKVFSKLQGYTYVLRLVAIEGDECLPYGWKGGVGSLYSTCEIIDEESITASSSTTSSTASVKSPPLANKRPSSSALSSSSSSSSPSSSPSSPPSSTLSVNALGSDTNKSTFKSNTRRYPDVCPTVNGEKMGALLPSWPEAWVKRGSEIQSIRLEVSTRKVNNVDVFAAGCCGSGSSSKKHESDDVKGAESLEKEEEKILASSNCRCMSCGIKFKSMEETMSHICSVSDHNFDIRNSGVPRIGERVLCFLPDLSSSSSSVFDQVIWHGKWCMAEIVSFHSEEESVNLRDDLEMFLDLMSTTFE